MSVRTVLRNTGFLTMGRVFGDFFVFLMLVVIAREFGPEGNGRYGVAMSIAGFVAVLADFGLRALTIKEMSAHDAPADLPSRMLALRVPLSILALVGLILVLPFTGFGPEAGIIVLLIGIQQLLRRACEGLGMVFVAREQSQVASALELGAKLAGSIGVMGVVLADGGLVAAIAVLPAAEVLHLLVALAAVHRWATPLRAVRELAALRATFSAARPYAASQVLTQLYSRVDVLLIGLMLGTAAAGLYHVADRVIMVALLLPAFVAMSLFPTVTRALAGESGEAGRLCHASVGAILLVGVPATFALCAIAPLLVGGVFGAPFARSVGVLRMLAPMVLFVGLAECLGVFLTAAGRISTRVRHQALVALLNVLGNLALIPVLGIEGAALSTVATRALLVVCHARALAGTLGGRGPALRLGLACVGVAAVCGALGFEPDLGAGHGAALCLGVFAACLALFPKQTLGWARLLAGDRAATLPGTISDPSGPRPGPPRSPRR